MLRHAPTFSTADAERIARDLYGLDARATTLTSERDQNFLLESSEGAKLVLKIANALEDRALLEAQRRVLGHVGTTIDIVPRVVPTLAGDVFSMLHGVEGREHLAWAVSFLPGVPLALARRRSNMMLEGFGASIASLTRALADFDDAAAHRDFHWDLALGPTAIAQLRPQVTDEALGAAIDSILADFDRVVAPVLPLLPCSVIHGDLNDYNVIVSSDHDVWKQHDRISTIVDFGDMVHSYTVADLAIAAAYLALSADDPLNAIGSLVRGYSRLRPLSDDELRALFGLMALRLCVSACVAADQRRQNPDNAYLDVSQQAIARTLPLLARIPFGLAEAVLREACGLEPVESSARVRRWLAAHTRDFAPVIGVDLRSTPCAVLDLGIASALVSGDPRLNDERHLTARVAAYTGGTDVISVGQYDEPRLLYTAPFFSNGWSRTAERRTIHIGLDLFAPAGTPVFAPIAGVVHAFAENILTQDYGPVIVLRHDTSEGDTFFTLYGHLSRDSLVGLHAGATIARGEEFARLGTAAENVGWTPHLHLQVITDALGLDTDFPGVAPASQRTVWRSLSPDPNLIVGIPLERFPVPAPTHDESLSMRRSRLAGNLSVAYHDPLRIARGWSQYLYDDAGRRYIDAYNNVPHVGHSHPRIVSAAARQLAVLNTNTRYLSDSLAEYARRLTETLPAGLDVCVLVSSASEANELAIRMARSLTGHRDMIVLEAAYHGNTTMLIDLSPYKHAGPGGEGAPSWVHVAPLPDDYRGAHKRDVIDRGARYAAAVRDIVGRVRAQGRGLCGFIAETCPSVGGQLMLPPGYLESVYREVRSAGGVCIADEVQTGLGRIGTHFWAFEAHAVVPDIVVMGKPLGNGYPLAAVVTTRAIADAFDNGMEYFSTFGGSNVASAVGTAVLDVLHDEGLQSNALRVGRQMLAALGELRARHRIVGDVRGSGFFLGVELVRDRLGGSLRRQSHA